MADKEFDLIVIGGGPGGYVAAIRAAQLEMKVLLVDDRQNDDGKPAPGGTCLNIGCIPSKALLDSSKHFAHVKGDYADHGINVEKVSIDVEKMLKRKDGVVKQLTGGVNQLLKANKVEFVNGRGKLLADREVELSPHEGDAFTARGKHVIAGCRFGVLLDSQCRDRQRNYRRQRRRTGIFRSSQAAGRYRRRRDRSGNGQCMVTPGQ
jgi:dihydrolipoamide dehydrogenase